MSIKILTVDDSKTVRLIVGRALKRFDCLILEAANGAEGLAVAAREKPDLILLDYTMPVMDGLEMMGQLRAEADLRSIPVMMLTAESAQATILKMAQLGVRDYIVKPFQENDFVTRLSRIVNLQPRTAATPAPVVAPPPAPPTPPTPSTTF